jgi:hypothetical protein
MHRIRGSGARGGAETGDTDGHGIATRSGDTFGAAGASLTIEAPGRPALRVSARPEVTRVLFDAEAALCALRRRDLLGMAEAYLRGLPQRAGGAPGGRLPGPAHLAGDDPLRERAGPGRCPDRRRLQRLRALGRLALVCAHVPRLGIGPRSRVRGPWPSASARSWCVPSGSSCGPPGTSSRPTTPRPITGWRACGRASSRSPRVGWPCVGVNSASAMGVGLAVAGLAYLNTGRHHH